MKRIVRRKAPLRLGIIDLGTNSVRFDIHEINLQGKSNRLYRERLMIRLGEGVFLNGRFDPLAVTRAMEAFASFRYTADQFAIQKIVAVATSAVRQAVDREKFVQALKRRTGIRLRVVSGQEEARLIARGVISNENNLPGKFALVDIGGGSTEVSFFKQGSLLWCSSLKLGSARLEQLFAVGAKDIDRKSRLNRIKQLRSYIRKVLDVSVQSNSWEPVDVLLGSSGTIKALLRLEQQSNLTKVFLTANGLKRIIKKISVLSRAKLLEVPGMDPKRIDIILAGAVLLDEIMKSFKASKVRFSDYALRDGLLDEEISILHKNGDSHLPIHLEDLQERLARYLTNPHYGQRISTVCQDLFVKLQAVHRLRPNWCALLSAAALLQNSGRAISVVQHAQHSFYIVQHLDFPWFEADERSLVAHLCLWHGQGKPSSKSLAFIKKTSERESFLKALSLLRLANALVWHERSAVRLLRVVRGKRVVKLCLSANGSSELVKLRVDCRKKLFEQIFKRQLIVQT